MLVSQREAKITDIFSDYLHITAVNRKLTTGIFGQGFARDWEGLRVNRIKVSLQSFVIVIVRLFFSRSAPSVRRQLSNF